ncbi:hypothetical protein EVAR_67211_1 [Eumeta japonica]|uniref:Uncharacterized protein n=1 Tax=Eumeta variegata TaxID=151549 RepID=A0A4C2A8Q9_EUMVA|nr:hypothetical protein EVAR_67211_1 [Eumeta japonica]
MEQIFMIEIFVKKIVIKIEPPEKDEYELKQEEEEKRKAEEEAAMKKGAKEKEKPKKEPPRPSEEELKFMKSCSTQMNCLPLFDFYIAHDNFIPPPPPTKGNKQAKAKKGIILPSEPLPEPPYNGVGNAIIFLSRPSQLEKLMKETPIYVAVWNRDQELNCVGFCLTAWHKSFIEALQKAAALNPMDLDAAEYRNTDKPHIVTNTVEYFRPLQCEEDLKLCGEIEFHVRLTCMGNRVVTSFIGLSEMDRIPGRKYLQDDLKLKDLEVVRHWDGTTIESLPPVAYFFGACDILKESTRPDEEEKVYEDFVAPYTNEELAILAMGFPKGPCGGLNCLHRMENRGSQHQFIPGQFKSKGVYIPGQFVNKRDVHGPCGRLDCPLAKKVRGYIANEGKYKKCKKPCDEEYY